MSNRNRLLLAMALGVLLGAAAIKLSTLAGQAQARPVDWAELQKSIDPGRLYFAQQADDVIIARVFSLLKIERPTYLDIGACDPIVDSNTFLFYLQGSRGVLVEPNPELGARLKAVRPRDTVLPIGIGVTAQAEADYYVIDGKAQRNTFSKEEADKLVAEHGPQIIKQVLRLPLIDINTVIAQTLGSAPDLLSIDVEGLDLDILKTLDFEKYRPAVVCVETLRPLTLETNDEISALLTRHDYVVQGLTMVNSIFVDRRRLNQGALTAPSAPR